jgi:hypothetical protein
MRRALYALMETLFVKAQTPEGIKNEIECVRVLRD